MSDKLIPALTEFESKYRVEDHLLIKFKQIVGKLPNLKKFLYVEGEDDYHTKPDGSFARYRQAAHGTDGQRCEVTLKVKPEGARNNIIRREINWRTDITPKEAINAGLEMMGYKYNFSIYKICQIYILDDATLVFYTVFDTTKDSPSKTDTFVEIEVDEHLTSTLTEEQAMGIISKYEKVLEPIGLSAQRRLRKSLFELYVRD
jgi:adenylate cyclase class IV